MFNIHYYLPIYLCHMPICRISTSCKLSSLWRPNAPTGIQTDKLHRRYICAKFKAKLNHNLISH